VSKPNPVAQNSSDSEFEASAGFYEGMAVIEVLSGLDRMSCAVFSESIPKYLDKLSMMLLVFASLIAGTDAGG
jgi:hypothetical protein